MLCCTSRGDGGKGERWEDSDQEGKVLLLV